DPGALGCLAGVTRRASETRVNMQAAAVEVFGRLAIEPIGLIAGLSDADELQKAGAIRVPVLAEPVHLLPEAVHCHLPGLIAEIGQVGVDVIHLRAPAPGFDRAAARDPDRRMRLLHWARPDIDIALLVEAPVEGEGVLLGPRSQHEIMRLVIAVA